MWHFTSINLADEYTKHYITFADCCSPLYYATRKHTINSTGWPKKLHSFLVRLNFIKY